ncbi:MAG TPA: M20/M25/M40 family metallo-hydrolase, partial [Nitrososphaera sp.]|nr:M20/M25/M40 family metallo-hydrolase [Nitrososphaera sp.]
MYDFWRSIKSEIDGVEIEGNRTKSVSCTLTEIAGGSSHNVTPQKCKITMDIRIPMTSTTAEVLRILDGVVTRVAAKKGITTRYRIEDAAEPFEASHTSKLVRALSLSILDVCKARPLLLRKTGTGDMNILGGSFNIPMVTYGPGDPHASHSTNERIDLKEYLSSVEVYGRTLFHISRLHDHKRAQV